MLSLETTLTPMTYLGKSPIEHVKDKDLPTALYTLYVLHRKLSSVKKKAKSSIENNKPWRKLVREYNDISDQIIKFHVSLTPQVKPAQSVTKEPTELELYGL